jgi:beta-lactamase class A
MEKSGLIGRLAAEALLLNANIGVYYEDLNSGETVMLNPDEPFPLASVIKVPVMVYVMVAAERGLLKLEETLDLDLSAPEFEQPDGSGTLRHLTSQVALSLRDLAMLMMIDSDNLATNVLIERCGGFDPINAYLSELGLVQTRLNHLILDFPTLRKEGVNPGTAREISHLYALIHRNALPYSELMWDMLGRQKYTSRIPYFLPTEDEGLKIGNKTGSVNTLTHDSALIRHPQYAYTLTILTRHTTTTAIGALLIARCAELIHRYHVLLQK